MQAIGHLLPIAVAVAVSSVPILVAMVLLLSPQRSRTALPYLIGWVAGIAILLSVCALIAHALPARSSATEPDVWIGVGEILVGLALVVLGVLTFRRRGRAKTTTLPMGLGSVSRLGAWSSLALGFVLNLRPKGLLLAIAGGLVLRADAGSVPMAIVAVIIFTVIAASTVAAPVIAVTVAPGRTEPTLARIQEWMLSNGGVLTAAILVLIGVVVFGMGLVRL